METASLSPALALVAGAPGGNPQPGQLERLRDNDPQALAEFFHEFADLVYRTALRLTGNRADAEDVTQEVFLRLPASAGGFTGNASAFPGWIRTVAVRHALMLLRRGRRRREVGVDDVSGLVAPSVAAVDRLTIHDALALLPDQQRHVFLLKEVEGYTHAEIAELLGVSTAASEVRLHRARRALRELLRGSR